MPEWVLLTKAGCAGCDDMKEMLMLNGVGQEMVLVLSVDTVDGLAWAAFAERVGQPVPVLVNARSGEVYDDLAVIADIFNGFDSRLI